MKIRNKNSWIWKLIFEELPMKKILRINYKWDDLLYEFPAETRLTVYRGSTYWCVGKPHPKGTATFYNGALFEHVSHEQNFFEMKIQ